MKEIDVDLKFKISGQLKPSFNKFVMGKYVFSKIPSGAEKHSELILSFKDIWKEEQKHSDPEKEGEIILAWLSVILRQKVEFGHLMLNKIDFPYTNREKISYEKVINFPENILNLYNKFKSLPLSEGDNLLERYIRACECYKEALLLSSESPNVSFFLFVVAVECLSDKNQNFYEYLMKETKGKENITREEIQNIFEKFNEDFGSKKKFIRFILDHFEEWRKDFSEEEFKELLSAVYSIRSKFIHEGRNLKHYIDLVDNNLKSRTVYILINNKKIELPGLNYLSYFIGKVLINFLESQNMPEIDNIPKLASSDSRVDLILSNQDVDIKEGQFVSGDLIKYRK